MSRLTHHTRARTRTRKLTKRSYFSFTEPRAQASMRPHAALAQCVRLVVLWDTQSLHARLHARLCATQTEATTPQLSGPSALRSWRIGSVPCLAGARGRGR